jgi:hypothetical protein
MDEMTQQNAALVREAAAAVDSIRAQASDLNTRVGTFKICESDVQTQAKNRVPDRLSPQFDELPSVSANQPKTSNRALPAMSQEDEWESFK